jgi:DNA-binding NtrC family response regulator
MSSKRAILVVDDEAVLLLSIKQELRLKFGSEYRYEIAMSAEQGLDVIARLMDEGVEVVLIISDWLMPGMRGDELLKRIRAMNPLVKLVMMSGHADRSQMEELAAEAELFAFMSKPFKSAQLFDIVRRAMTV